MITEKTGTNAGKLWELLNKKSPMSFKDAKKRLKMTIPDIYMAMGWLNREDKLLIEGKDEMMLSLKG